MTKLSKISVMIFVGVFICLPNLALADFTLLGRPDFNGKIIHQHTEPI